MSDVQALRARVAAARVRLHGIPATGPGQLGAPDPKTGEQWHRGNVLGHVAEMLPFWAGQLERAAAGAAEVGRDASGLADRRAGIERGTVLAEAELRAQVEGGLDRLEAVLDRLSDGDLGRELVYRPSSGEPHRTTIRGFIEDLLVGHLEGHLDQLESLT